MPQTRGLTKNKNLFTTILMFGNSKIKVPVNSVFAAGPLDNFSPGPHMANRPGIAYKDPVPEFITSKSSHTLPLGIRISVYEVGWKEVTNIQITVSFTFENSTICRWQYEFYFQVGHILTKNSLQKQKSLPALTCVSSVRLRKVEGCTSFPNHLPQTPQLEQPHNSVK